MLEIIATRGLKFINLHFAFLASLDRYHDTWMFQAEILASLDAQYSREKRVSIVDRATAIHETVLYHGIARVGQPALTERLLVEMPVHEHAVIRRWTVGPRRRLNIDNQKGTATRILFRRNLCSFDANLLGERDHVVHGLEQIAILLPLFVEDGRKRRNPDKL